MCSILLLWVLAACQTVPPKGVPGADLQLGLDAYELGDYQIALREFKPLAERGNAEAQARLGTMYWLGLGVPADDPEAAKWLQRATAQGNSQARVGLAMLYLLGSGVRQDYAQAAELLREPAEQGIPQAQFFLGLLYMHGNGVPVDRVEAYKWFQLAEKHGDRSAGKARRLVAKEMTLEQIAEAEDLAGKWKPAAAR